MAAPPDDTSASAPARVPPPSEIADIIAMSGAPSLRNLRITACYGELSRAMADRIGRDNVNWCTFATWASRTAGRFIRLADLDQRVRAAVETALERAGAGDPFQRSVRHLSDGFGRTKDRIVEATKELAADTSAEVAAGNLTVFAELAPLFSSLIATLDSEVADPRAAVSPIIESLKPGPTSQGGQDLLRRAVSDYADACRVADPRQKAEIVLRANAQVGAHEQIRLQPYIHNAMTASLSARVSTLYRNEADAGVPASRARSVSALLEARLRPYRMTLEAIWLEVATSYLMTLELPDGTLRLGRDLPHLPGEPIYPADLDAPRDAELLRILRIYRADGTTAYGSGASVWSDLSDRLRYILELFRSRQQDRRLFEPPFGTDAMTAIRSGIVPLLGI